MRVKPTESPDPNTEGQPDETPEKDVKDEETPSPPPETEPGNQSGNGDDEKPKFTQADLDRATTERKNKERAAWENWLKNVLGVADKDALSELVKQQKEREDAEKSELEKAQSQLDQANSKIEELQAQIETMTDRAKRERLNAAIKDKARGLEANDPDEIVILLTANAETLASLTDDDGEVDTKAVGKALDEMKKNKPHLYRPARGTPGSPPHNDGNDTDTPPDETKLQKEAAEHYRKYRP